MRINNCIQKGAALEQQRGKLNANYSAIARRSKLQCAIPFEGANSLNGHLAARGHRQCLHMQMIKIHGSIEQNNCPVAQAVSSAILNRRAWRMIFGRLMLLATLASNFVLSAIRRRTCAAQRTRQQRCNRCQDEEGSEHVLNTTIFPGGEQHKSRSHILDLSHGVGALGFLLIGVLDCDFSG
jgi:hypothetical protein